MSAPFSPRLAAAHGWFRSRCLPLLMSPGAACAAATRQLGPVDGILLMGALAFGAVSLFYPFGGDQGLYAYVGREWLQGTIPYRDAMEQKTPLIFALHALLVLLTGTNMWAIRAAELGFVLVVGVAVADLASDSAEPRRPGVLGIACLATSVLYYGLFDYWDTAQCEIWYAGLSLWALRVITRREISRVTWLLGGGLAGLALLMKPPAAFLNLVVVVVAAARAARSASSGRRLGASLSALSLLALGAALPIGVTVAYFVSVGAFEHLIDVAVRANHHDMLHSSSVSNAGDVALRFGEWNAATGPLTTATLVVAVVGLLTSLARRRDAWTRYGVAVALLLAGAAAVVVQRKFYAYHWGALAPLMALPLACVAHDLSARRAGGLGQPAFSGRQFLLVAALLAAFAASNSARPYAATVALTGQYLAGHIGREEALAPFARDENTPYAQHEVVGRWIAERSGPDELVAVRGFEQAIYTVARRRAPTRFFWTRWLTEPRRAYRREQWLAEDEQALRRRPPRFVVVSDRARKGPASREHFTTRGYVEVFRHGRLIVLERGATGGYGVPQVLRRAPGTRVVG